MSLSEGIYAEESYATENTDSNGNDGNLNVDIETPKSIEYNVMITLNDNCLRNSGAIEYVSYL